MELENIDKLIITVEQSANSLYMNDIVSAQENLAEIVSKVSSIYKELIADTMKYSEVGVEIPGGILCDQIKNLTEAVAQSDIIGIADTLAYEIKQGLLFYKEVKGIVV